MCSLGRKAWREKLPACFPQCTCSAILTFPFTTQANYRGQLLSPMLMQSRTFDFFYCSRTGCQTLKFILPVHLDSSSETWRMTHDHGPWPWRSHTTSKFLILSLMTLSLLRTGQSNYLPLYHEPWSFTVLLPGHSFPPSAASAIFSPCLCWSHTGKPSSTSTPLHCKPLVHSLLPAPTSASAPQPIPQLCPQTDPLVSAGRSHQKQWKRCKGLLGYPPLMKPHTVARLHKSFKLHEAIKTF